MENYVRKMKDMDWYLGVTYNNICQPAIMAETQSTFPEPEIPTIALNTVVNNPKIDKEKTRFKK